MKLKCFIRQCMLLLVMLAGAGTAAIAQGPGNAIFYSSDSARAFNLGTDLRDSLATTDFTIELWLKVVDPALNIGTEGLIGSKSYASGANTGFFWHYTGTAGFNGSSAPARVIRFNFATSAGAASRRDVDMYAANEYIWNHYAITVDRAGTIKGYINGVLKVTSASIASHAGQSIAGTLPIYLGQDGTGAWSAKLNGNMDEVRIWKTARTEQELRDNMCHKLSGTEAGLLSYYRMDHAVGATGITNSAAATTGLFNGTATAAAPKFVISGAPVGDASVNIYTTNWAGQSLQMATADRGVFTVDSFGNGGSYLHLYRIHAAPDSTDGLTGFSNNDVSFGAYASGDTFSYYPKYDYTNYVNANTFEAGLIFFNRKFNDQQPWSYKSSIYKNTAARIMRLDSVQGTRQFFLANFITNCTGVPSALTASDILPESALLSWTGHAAASNIQYGPAGFTLGSGTVIRGLPGSSYKITGLLPNTTYSYYVADSCLYVGSGSWAGPYTFTTSPSYAAFGSGYALQSSNTSPQAFNLGTGLNDSLALSDFTLEMWVKIDPASTAGNPPLLANKNYTSGGNNGISWTYSASSSGPGASQIPGSFRFNFKTNSGTTGSSGRHDYDIKPVNPYTWNHIAMTVTRRGAIKGYVNGIYQPNMYNGGNATGVGSPDIAADSLKSLATNTLNMYLAQDGTGNYSSGYFFQGAMDEVRIWQRALDSTELRANMCQKLQGNEEGLLAYYRLNELPGSTVITNSAAATTGLFKGTATATPPSFVISGAPVGDTSVSLYTNDWAGKSLLLATPNRGTFTVDSFAKTGTYLHLYRVNNVPNFKNGLTAFSTNNVEFGVFDGDGSFNYKATYNYANYDTAMAYKNVIYFSTRQNNADSLWTGKFNNYNNTVDGVLGTDSVNGTRQFFLANMSFVCDTPFSLSVTNITGSSAQLNWTTGGSGLWNIQYGPSGFTLGNGTQIKAVTNNPYTLTRLQGNTTYSFYIQDSCVGIGNSAWVGPFTFTTITDYAAFGSGYALHFNGNGVTNSTTNGVNLGTALRDSLAYSDFTIEMWVKVGNSNTNNPSLIANKDYVNGANPGISWNYAAPGNAYGSAPGHHFRFNFTTQGGTTGGSGRHDYDVPAANEYVWNHVAVTVDRKGKIKGYINGVYYANRLGTSGVASDDISADSARSLATGALPLYLGTDGTGNYRSPFNGDMDEVRIWKRVLDSTGIRAAMCHKLQGNEEGLLAYYRMDETIGTTVYNSAAATSGSFDGTFTTNAPTHVISGAPIGDTSVFLYPGAGWAGQTLSLNSNGQGTFTVDSVTAGAAVSSVAVPGVHIYRVHKVPNYVTGIADIGGTDRYFGVFAADNASAYYRSQYDFSAYPAAVSSAAHVNLYTRSHNAANVWTQLPAGKTGNVAQHSGFSGTRQYLLADFSESLSCATPTDIVADSITNVFARLTWSSAAPTHIVKHGPAGFAFDTAAPAIVSDNNKSYTDLTSDSYYDFYIRDSCSANAQSVWVGPYTYATAGACPAPVNVHVEPLTDTSFRLVWEDLGKVTSSYAIAWGIEGSFSHPDSATYLPVFSGNQVFSGLQPNTTYVFYIKVFCNDKKAPTTGWVGPFTFTTPAPSSVAEINAGQKVIIYPNPATHQLNIEFPDGHAASVADIAVLNSLGMVVHHQAVANQERKMSINTSSLASGVYLIRITATEGNVYHHKVIITK